MGCACDGERWYDKKDMLKDLHPEFQTCTLLNVLFIGSPIRAACEMGAAFSSQNDHFYTKTGLLWLFLDFISR